MNKFQYMLSELIRFTVLWIIIGLLVNSVVNMRINIKELDKQNVKHCGTIVSVDESYRNNDTVKVIITDPRITVLFSSHDMGDKILTWEQYFKEPFPYQSYVALVVSKSMAADTKARIITDVSKVFSSKEFKDTTFNTGLLPIGSTENWMINSVLKSNKALTRFIQNNKLEIKQ